MPASKPQTKRGEGPRTEYLVLGSRPHEYAGQASVWTAEGTVIATSAATAIRKKLAIIQGVDECRYVAIPMRSWQPQILRIKRTETTTLVPMGRGDSLYAAPSNEVAKPETAPDPGQGDELAQAHLDGVADAALAMVGATPDIDPNDIPF